MTATDPQPPPKASALYKTLFATAIEFIRSQDQDLTQLARMNFARVRAIRSPTHTHLFGHNYFVSTKPPFQGEMDLERYIAHLNTMLPRLESWDTRITDIAVDEMKRVCVVRGSYFIEVKGVGKAVENDIVWWLWMDGEGKLVERGMEFVDGVATGRIRELIRGMGE